MGILKRAIRSITRRKGKTIILFLIVFILGNVIAASVSVKQSTVNLEKQIKAQLGTTSSIEPDYEKIEKDMKDGILKEDEFPGGDQMFPTAEAIKSIGSLPQVNYYDYRLDNSLESKTLKQYQSDSGGITTFGSGNAYFNIRGYGLEELLEVKEEKISLSSGKLPTQAQLDEGANVAIISKQLAEENALNVGDSITLINAIYDYSDIGGNEAPKPVKEQEVIIEVVGIFEVHSAKDTTKSKDQQDMQEWRDTEEMNRIYTSIGLAEREMQWQSKEYLQMMVDKGEDTSLWGDDSSYVPYTAKFVLKDPSELDSFKSDAAPYLPNYSKVISNSDSYDAIAQPIKKLATISDYILIAGSAVSILILTLIVILFLRDRKHELGIYLSLGESKIKVFQQIFIEVFAISIIAMTLALFSGNLIAKQVSSGMIPKTDDPYGMNMGMSIGFDDIDITTEDIVDQYEVTFTPQIVLLYYGVGILTVLLSTAGPMLYILRLEPKKILM